MDRHEIKYFEWRKKATAEEQDQMQQLEWKEFVNATASLVMSIPNIDLEALVQIMQKNDDPRKAKAYSRTSYLFTENNGTEMLPEARKAFLTLAWAKLDATI